MRDTCESLCSVALCCIIDDKNNNCATNKDNKDTCKEYIKYCYNIWFDDYYNHHDNKNDDKIDQSVVTTSSNTNTNTFVSLPVKPLDTICSQKSISTEIGMK